MSPGCQMNFCTACDGSQSPYPGTDTSTVPRPLFGSVPYGPEVSKCKSPGKIAITFDDGPSPFTSELLDILKESGAKVSRASSANLHAMPRLVCIARLTVSLRNC